MRRCDSVDVYTRQLAEASPAVNVGLLVGHTTLRANTMGADLGRAATGEETAQMAAMLDAALAEGAIGMSSGLAYPPAHEAPMDEVVTLARVLAGHRDAIYTTHMRDESDHVLAAVRETLDTGAAAGVPVVISHHKCSGKAS